MLKDLHKVIEIQELCEGESIVAGSAALYLYEMMEKGDCSFRPGDIDIFIPEKYLQKVESSIMTESYKSGALYQMSGIRTVRTVMNTQIQLVYINTCRLDPSKEFAQGIVDAFDINLTRVALSDIKNLTSFIYGQGFLEGHRHQTMKVELCKYALSARHPRVDFGRVSKYSSRYPKYRIEIDPV